MKLTKRFFPSIGLVEQSQIVASTAVVVAMVTIVIVHFVTGAEFTWLDFINLLTYGVFGYVTVYFSLKYGRMMEDQRRELLALNSIAEAVHHSMELDLLLPSALEKVMEMMHAHSGWIYLLEGERLTLRHQSGMGGSFFSAASLAETDAVRWVVQPGMHRGDDPKIVSSTTEEVRRENFRIIASIPLVRQGMFGGVMLIAGRETPRFLSGRIELLRAFGNQISAALEKAWLFEQVRRSERLYADLYDYSPDMYHSVDQYGIIRSCNLTESEMLGYPKEQIIGQPILKLYPRGYHDTLHANMRRLFTTGQEIRGVEEQIARADGSLIDVSLNTSLVRDVNGHPTLVRMVMRDITEKKKMEEKILQAQKIDSIGSLAGGIAHDFNNILTAILGSASIMRRKITGDSPFTKYVDLIETTSRRGAAVTRQLLTFARKNNPSFQPVDLNTIIDQTLRLFEATTPKTIHIKCTLEAEPMLVEGDEGQLQQAILNLCLNARDAMPQGGVLVLTCRPVYLDNQHARQLTDGKAGEYVLLSVVDSGCGIPSNLLNKIYEPFFTTKDQGKGTGLGLAVVYGVVRSHNGYINVESEVNSGTVFTVYLPRIVDGRQAHQSAARSHELVGGRERILLVEDEISIGVVGSDILRDLGYEIEIARNGREAVQMIVDAKTPFDLVILDMNMPRMGGRAAFDRIKELCPDLKVLVCSGYSTTIFEDGNFAQLVDGFLQKPYELEEIARKIRNILDPPVVQPAIPKPGSLPA
ncbi:MAG TPA: PAS domain S-box protein [Bacteroidota bacterium]|nr:PAS domain S-box protein [Bacteroidota bacterium]